MSLLTEVSEGAEREHFWRCGSGNILKMGGSRSTGAAPSPTGLYNPGPGVNYGDARDCRGKKRNCETTIHLQTVRKNLARWPCACATMREQSLRSVRGVEGLQTTVSTRQSQGSYGRAVSHRVSVAGSRYLLSDF